MNGQPFKLPTEFILAICIFFSLRFLFALGLPGGYLPDSSRYFGSIGAFGGWSIIQPILFTVFPFELGVRVHSFLISVVWAWTAWLVLLLSNSRKLRFWSLGIVGVTSIVPWVYQWDWMKMLDGLLIASGALLICSLALLYATAEFSRVSLFSALGAALLMSFTRPTTLLFWMTLLIICLTPIAVYRRLWRKREFAAAIGILIVAAPVIGLLALDTSNYWKPFQANNRLMFRGGEQFFATAREHGMPACPDLERLLRDGQNYSDRNKLFRPLPRSECPEAFELWVRYGGLSPVAEVIGHPAGVMGQWLGTFLEIQRVPLILSQDDEVLLETSGMGARQIPEWIGNGESRETVMGLGQLFTGLLVVTGLASLFLRQGSIRNKWAASFYFVTAGGSLVMYLVLSYVADPMEVQRHALPASALLGLAGWNTLLIRTRN